MTKREFLKAIAEGTMNEEIMAKAAETLESMDEANAKRAAKVTEKSSEAYAPFIELFASALTDEGKTASDLLPLFEGMTTPAGKEPSVQFVSSVGRKVVEQGLAAKVDVKITGKGKQVAYIKKA